MKREYRISKHSIQVRFVERPLSERSLAPQIEQIRSTDSLRELKISSVGIEMLTALVGRGMSPSLRRVVADALLETMQGQLPLGDEAADNIFIEVYGEVIGPLLTCLESGGDFEIIRLAQKKGADLLLVDRATQEVILQECKGSFADYNKVQEDGSDLDVCQQIRNQRNKGRKQLQWPEASEITSRRIRVHGGHKNQESAIPHGKKTVVVTAMPDGRLKSCGRHSDAPAHDPCDTNCSERCLFTPEPTLICVLSSEEVDGSTPLDGGTRAFLDWCKACERAIWGNAHGSVGHLFSNTISHWRQLDISTMMREATVPLLTGLLERAVQRNVYIEFGPIFEVSEGIQQPELRHILREVHDLQGDTPRPRISEIEPRELGRMLHGTDDSDRDTEHLVGNWRFHTGHLGSEEEGTSAEASIQREGDGGLVMRVVPSQTAIPSSVDDLCWGIADILSGGRFPSKEVYRRFTDETVSWAATHANSERRPSERPFALGKVLETGWPFWSPLFDRRTLQDMHHCCPYCDMLADWIEAHSPFPPPFFSPWDRRCCRRHRRGRWPEGVNGQSLAFVTSGWAGRRGGIFDG
jgi:hypothetical protein